MRAIILFSQLVIINFMLSADELTINEMRIKWNYQNGNYNRCYQLAKNNLHTHNTSELVHYCYATSLFKIEGNNIKPLILDKVLYYLKKAKPFGKNKISSLLTHDSVILDSIKEKAIQLSEKELKKFPTRSIKRLETIIAIYGDTAEIYRFYKLEEQKVKELNLNKLAILTNKDTSCEIPAMEHNSLLYTVEKVNTKTALDTLEQWCGTKLNEKQKQILITAMQYNQVSRYPNKKNNPQILLFFHELGFKKINDDETSWCAAFVNYCLNKMRYPHPGTLLAKDWIKNGKTTSQPQPGDIVVFWREKKNGWQGHVAFFIKDDKARNLIYAFGGNQGGSVCLKAFPKECVLAYRKITE